MVYQGDSHPGAESHHKSSVNVSQLVVDLGPDKLTADVTEPQSRFACGERDGCPQRLLHDSAHSMRTRRHCGTLYPVECMSEMGMV